MSEQAQGHKHTNRLVQETSPYLLQHAHNPVDWYPWGEEALQRARREDKLILLSIGYSACHWCHVMERESFEDEAIAAQMNEHFVNIKVDREERPDLDEIYMAATLTMNQGQGGWPMTVFLTPDIEPVFAGTYFPPSDQHGRPGFPTVLREVARAWREDPEALRGRASEFAAALRQRQSLGPGQAVGVSELRAALEAYKAAFDPRFGGFGSAPKFPPAVALTLLLRLHRRFGDAQALSMVRKTLEGMARGGMYDHVGGGFARYSTDERWLVPHFEKMLYDNALLVKAYLEGYQATGETFFKRTATETLDYMLREMVAPEGGIYSSTDADSEGVEGKFFVWTPAEVAQVLDREEARRFNAYYDITLAGNWEGVSIPNTPRPLADVAAELGVAGDELERSLESARTKLYAARQQRVKPGLDDKILTAWNGLMIGALAEGYRVLSDHRYWRAAEQAAEFVLARCSADDGRLLRTYRAGVAHLNAYLEDYAYLSEGLIDLYEAAGDVRWLREAERLLARFSSDFIDEDTGAFYSTARDHERLIMRYRDGADGATPAANAVAALSLARLSYHLDRPDLRHVAVRAIKAYGPLISRFPRGFAKSLCTVDFLLDGPVELAFVGTSGSAQLTALQTEVAKHYLPNRIQAIVDPADPAGADALPLTQGKSLVNGRAALYICRDFACRAPITDPAEIGPQLETVEVGDAGPATIGIHVPGRATQEGTSRYAARFAAGGYTPLGITGLTTSRLGFGCYRVHDAVPQHRASLEKALRCGINLIDTSTNYADGASERLVGSMLRRLIDAGELQRDEVIVISKIGYVQGEALGQARVRQERGAPYPEIVKYEEELWHCIHPDYLDEQLQRSLDRLELETLDVCLLHNPEYFLADAARRGVPLQQARDEFERRLGEAFAYLHRQVDECRLAAYGVSSNTLVSPVTDSDATSLTRMIAAAKSAAGKNHRFRVVELPLNLLETGAVLEPREGSDQTLTALQAAQDERVAVLVNRPLNAFVQSQLVRLADPAIEETDLSLDEQLARVEDLELAFRTEIAPRLQADPSSLSPEEYFRMAERLKDLSSSTFGLAQWSQLEARINLTVTTVTRALDTGLDGETAELWAEWRDSYLAELDDLLRELCFQAALRSEARIAELRAAIDPLLPGDYRDESFARKALWVVASTPGVTCVLNGMRAEEYVDDAVDVLVRPQLGAVSDIYKAARSSLSAL